MPLYDANNTQINPGDEVEIVDASSAWFGELGEFQGVTERGNAKVDLYDSGVHLFDPKEIALAEY